MRKGIVALAVMSAFSGAALAQSSVTLYGIVDIGYQWNEAPTNVGTTAAPRIVQESYSAINGGHQSGNRWGLRGSEDLGGGWKALRLSSTMRIAPRNNPAHNGWAWLA